MKKKKNLYIQILLWCYEKGTEGFTREELTKAFYLDGKSKQHEWIQSNFFHSTNNRTPLLSKGFEENGKDFFVLTERGMAAAIDYIELNDARKSSKIALYIAIFSIVINIFSVIYQIVMPQKVFLLNNKLEYTNQDIEYTNQDIQCTSYKIGGEVYKLGK